LDSTIIQNPKKIILTHIDYSSENKIADWFSDLSETNKNKFLIAKDGMEIDL